MAEWRCHKEPIVHQGLSPAWKRDIIPSSASSSITTRWLFGESERCIDRTGARYAQRLYGVSILADLYFDPDLTRLLCKSPIQSAITLVFFCFLRALYQCTTRQRKRERGRDARLMIVPGQKRVAWFSRPQKGVIDYNEAERRRWNKGSVLSWTGRS